VSTVLAIDPGRDKCGIAVLSPQGDILLHEIVPTGALETRVSELAAEYAPRIIMGDGTTSAATKARIEAQVGAVTLVDEYRTTEEGRRLYWAENPPRGRGGGPARGGGGCAGGGGGCTGRRPRPAAGGGSCRAGC
jgi:resolvase, RNase H domain protein